MSMNPCPIHNDHVLGCPECNPPAKKETWIQVIKPWLEYPEGTIAKDHTNGAWWLKTDRGWRAVNNGVTFPEPGAGATHVKLPRGAQS